MNATNFNANRDNQLSAASATLLILSIICAFLDVFLMNRVIHFKILNLIDTCLIGGSASMWTVICKEVASSFKSSMFQTDAAVSTGPVFWILWISCGFKFLVFLGKPKIEFAGAVRRTDEEAATSRGELEEENARRKRVRDAADEVIRINQMNTKRMNE